MDVADGRWCVTCGGEIIQERWELGYRYCTDRACVRENHQGLTILEIGQTKTNAVYEIMTEKTLRDMREGKYRRDPIVVSRQPAKSTEIPRGTFKPAKTPQYNRARVRYVQALADQGYRVDDILTKGAYMNLTRREVHQYIAGKRI